MNRNACAFALAAIFLVTLSLSATVQRTFVSPLGNDANTCVIDQPCRNFAAAILQTTAGGEVVALASAGYGPIPIIDKSISIIAPLGVHAAMTVSGGLGIDISATGGSVLLRNLFLTGLGGTNGIYADNISSLELDHCTIAGFTSDGLVFTPAAAGKLVVADSVFRKNGTDGIAVFGISPNFAAASIIRSRTELNNGSGIAAWGFSRVYVEDTQSVGNLDTGFVAVEYADNQSILLHLDRCTAFDNTYGVRVFLNGHTPGTPEIRVNDSTISSNAFGVIASPGTVLSRQNNNLSNNTTDGTFTGTYAPQ